MATAGGVLGLKADPGLGQFSKPVGWWPPRGVLCWTFSEGSPGVSGRSTPFFPPEPVPKAAHLAVAQAQGSGLPLGPRAPLKGSTVRLELPGPHHPRLNNPKRLHHKEHYSLLIRLPLETGISTQKACLLPDQTGECCHPPTPTDCLRREFATKPGLCPFPRATGTLHTSPYRKS